MSFGAEIPFAKGGQAEILYADLVFHRPCLEKRYFNGRRDKVFWQAEIDALCSLWQAGVRVPELLATDSSDCSMVIQRIERCENLEQMLKGGRVRTCTLASQILDSLCEQITLMHEIGWFHLDLSPGNVLVDWSGDVWLIDFALAQHVSNLKPLTFGKRKYIPPRYWELPRERNDWHAAGVIAEELEAACQQIRLWLHPIASQPHPTLDGTPRQRIAVFDTLLLSSIPHKGNRLRPRWTGAYRRHISMIAHTSAVDTSSDRWRRRVGRRRLRLRRRLCRVRLPLL
jgi:hypothetical protein